MLIRAFKIICDELCNMYCANNNRFNIEKNETSTSYKDESHLQCSAHTFLYASYGTYDDKLCTG